MEALRDLMRRSLARSLQELPPEDRFHAAWPLVCGSALAAHGEVLYLDREDLLHVRVEDSTWRERFFEMRGRIAADLGHVAGAPLAGIHFEKLARRTEGSLERKSRAVPPARPSAPPKELGRGVRRMAGKSRGSKESTQ